MGTRTGRRKEHNREERAQRRNVTAVGSGPRLAAEVAPLQAPTPQRGNIQNTGWCAIIVRRERRHALPGNCLAALPDDPTAATRHRLAPASARLAQNHSRSSSMHQHNLGLSSQQQPDTHRAIASDVGGPTPGEDGVGAEGALESPAESQGRVTDEDKATTKQQRRVVSQPHQPSTVRKHTMRQHGYYCNTRTTKLTLSKPCSDNPAVSARSTD
jgi:hypothetical protein